MITRLTGLHINRMPRQLWAVRCRLDVTIRPMLHHIKKGHADEAARRARAAAHEANILIRYVDGLFKER